MSVTILVINDVNDWFIKIRHYLFSSTSVTADLSELFLRSVEPSSVCKLFIFIRSPGSKCFVSSEICKSVSYRREHIKRLTPKIADLPTTRLKHSPPITYVGLECFGPCSVTTWRTPDSMPTLRSGQLFSPACAAEQYTLKFLTKWIHPPLLTVNDNAMPLDEMSRRFAQIEAPTLRQFPLAGHALCERWEPKHS